MHEYVVLSNSSDPPLVQPQATAGTSSNSPAPAARPATAHANGMTPLPTNLSGAGATRQHSSSPLGAPDERSAHTRSGATSTTTRPSTTIANNNNNGNSSNNNNREREGEERKARGGGGGGGSSSGEEEPPIARDKTRSNFALSFNVEFENDRDTVYFAHCYPYRYSDLQVRLPSGNLDNWTSFPY